MKAKAEAEAGGDDNWQRQDRGKVVKPKCDSKS